METPRPAPGLIVAPLTPFGPDLKVDETALRRQIDYVVEDCGATMVVAAGVETQEYTYLSLEQRKALIRQTVKDTVADATAEINTVVGGSLAAITAERTEAVKQFEDAAHGLLDRIGAARLEIPVRKVIINVGDAAGANSVTVRG